MNDMRDATTATTRAEEMRVVEAVECALGVRADGVRRICRGITNTVYEVGTADGPVIVKVFAHAGWPEAHKLCWLDRQLDAHGIARARLLHYSRAPAFFAHGYMISECVQGPDADMDADVGLRQASLPAMLEFFARIATVLRRVHAIEVRRFGRLNRGAGTHHDFLRQRLGEGADDDVEGDVDRMRTSNREPHLRSLVRAAIRRNVEPFEARLIPVVTHGDPHPKNCIWQQRGRLVLVDWDNAAASVWVRDYAHLTYLMLKRPHMKDHLSEIRRAFFSGYGPVDLPAEAIEAIEKSFHLVWAYNALVSGCDDHPEATQASRDHRDHLLALL